MQYYKIGLAGSNIGLINSRLPHRVRFDPAADDRSWQLVYFLQSQPAYRRHPRIKSEILDWCGEEYGKIGYDWGVQYDGGISTIFLKTESDMVAFKLKWE